MGYEKLMETCMEAVGIGKELQKAGILAIDLQGDMDIHLADGNGFFEWIPDEAVETKRIYGDFPWKYAKMYNGIEFYYITDRRVTDELNAENS